jgi:uncharacterized protein (DUF2252 family)
MRAAPPRHTRRQAEDTVEDRVAIGRAARVEAPRSAHGTWQPAAGRDPLAILEAEARGRIAALVPIRYGRMAASPVAFYRGAAGIMAADLAAMPRTGLVAQLCGDAHLANFGGFAAPDRRLVFSLNDFDETHPGPFEWDVQRLVASLEVAGRDRGFSEGRRESIVLAAVRTYREAMAGFATMPTLDVWYTRLDARQLYSRWGASAGAKEARAMERAVARARARDHERAQIKLTEVVDGARRFVDRPPLLVRLADLDDLDASDRMLVGTDRLMRAYASTLSRDRQALLARFRLVDVARKVVGVGSVGTRDWVVLLVGRDHGDPLILQFKEAQASVLEGALGRSAYRHHGRRVVEGQRLMQAASDILLGWQREQGVDGIHRDYYVRQLWDSKATADIESLTAHGLALYASFCGWTLARAHARSGDPVAIASYLGTSGTFDRAMVRFAESYADQNGRDHEALRLAIAAGRIEAHVGI